MRVFIYLVVVAGACILYGCKSSATTMPQAQPITSTIQPPSTSHMSTIHHESVTPPASVPIHNSSVVGISESVKEVAREIESALESKLSVPSVEPESPHAMAEVVDEPISTTSTTSSPTASNVKRASISGNKKRGPGRQSARNRARYGYRY
jgi:hypothetical protein